MKKSLNFHQFDMVIWCNGIHKLNFVEKGETIFCAKSIHIMKTKCTDCHPCCREFHQNQVLYVVSFVFVEMTGLGIARFFTDFEEDEVYMLTVSDARYLNVVYLFGHYSSFMSMRLPFKVRITLCASTYSQRVSCSAKICNQNQT